jgi:nucleoside-diphosphate-sugar epimerase
MRLFAFGLGYSALALARHHREHFAAIAGTVRAPEKAAALAAEGMAALVPGRDDAAIREELQSADALLLSAAPDAEGDPGIRLLGPWIPTSRIRWIGYLSTTGVYGDCGGAWIDETAPARPQSEASEQRLAAERAWLSLGAETGRAVQIFRLSGIYGPGRNALANVARGTAHRIVKPGQVFNRIHVEDIAAVLIASLARPRGGGIYNVADDEPAPAQDVVAYAARLLGREPPPEIPFRDARLSPIAARFYAENKRIRNRLIKDELGIRLKYPTYREGLDALFAAGEGRAAE